MSSSGSLKEAAVQYRVNAQAAVPPGDGQGGLLEAPPELDGADAGQCFAADSRPACRWSDQQHPFRDPRLLPTL